MKEIYLITSTSYHVINNKIKELAGDAEIVMHSLLDETIDDCIEDASYFGLFNENRVIVIKNTPYFGGKFLYEDDCNKLTNFLINMPDDTKIIFICDSITNTKEVTKKVKSLGAKILDYTNIDDDLMNELINDHLKLNNIKIEPKALNKLKESCLNNIDILIQDIDKISNIRTNITLDLVEEYSIKLEDIDTFEFSNAVIAKNFNKAFEILDKLIDAGIEAYSLVGLLASSYTNMYMVKEASSLGLSDQEIKEKFGYSSEGRVYVMKKNSKIYTLEELKDIIISLSDLDIKLKTGYNPVYGIKEFLLNL